MQETLRGLPAGIYLRISDDREGKELGVRRQDEDNRKLVDRLGVEVVDTYSDNDTSASTKSKKPRPDYNRLVQDARAGRIKVVLAYTSGRLTRRPREHEDLIDLAVEHGVKFFFVASPSFDLNTATGRRIARTLAAQDAGEAEDISERVMREKLDLAADGKHNGGQRAYGYGPIIGVNPTNGKTIRNLYALVPEEVPILHECKDRIIGGWSQMMIVKDLNARGIPTAKGYEWTVGKLRRILLKRTYIIFDPDDPEQRGTRVHKGTEYQAAYPGIFTRLEHDMLSAIFEKNTTPWTTDGVKPRSYLLSGVMFCGLCDGHVYGQGHVDRGRYVRRYHCKEYDNRGNRVGCGKVHRIANAVEAFVTECVLDRFDSPEAATALAPPEDKQRAHELTQALVQLQRRRKELAQEHAVTPYEDYGIMLTAIKQKMDAAQSELTRLQTDRVKRAMLPEISQLRQKWEDASIHWRASVIRLIVEKVILNPATCHGMRWNGWQFNPDDLDIKWVA
ncbi:MAG: recombinase family protein [Acidobacteria bacterium]|nr:recombinase family protein [Acidobacteriota bacterium]